MRSFLKYLFVDNWIRKLISLVLSIIIWFFVNRSMTVTKTIHNIPVKVTHLAADKTVDGVQQDGTLDRRATLVLTGNKSGFENLSGGDLQIVIDATGKGDEWVETIEKKHIHIVNPNLDPGIISSVTPYEMIVRQSRLVTEKIPILITRPIGMAPKGYQFLDVWPYQLFQSVTGPEDVVKQMKARGCKLTFNLSDISAADLDVLSMAKPAEEVSYFIPNSWKKVILHQFSQSPIEIDDPAAKTLRIDFSREELLPLDAPIPVFVFFPQQYSSTLNPETYQIALNDFIGKKKGIKMISTPLYVKGVSRHFLETVKDMIQLVVVAAPKSEQEILSWSIQFMQRQELEDRYVAQEMAEMYDAREELLRNRFRHYANSFRLYTPDGKKLALQIELQAQAISIVPQNLGLPSKGELVKSEPPGTTELPH